VSFQAKVGRFLTKAVNALGESVRYFHQDGGNVRIMAVFDNNFEVVDPNTETVVSSNHPRIGVKLADLLELPKKNDRVEFGRDMYKVVDCLEDGQGGASIWLHKI
jgi:hypothetical protein